MALSPEGATFVTTAPIPAGATIVAVDASGRTAPVSVIGSDPKTGVSALRADHPIAAGAAAVAGCALGSHVTALAFQPQPDGSVPVAWEPSTIEAVEISSQAGGAAVGSVTAGATLNATPGSALVDDQGRIVALADPTLGTNAYLPATLVVSLGHDLVNSISPAQVHLGITSRDTTGSIGAQVVSVSPDGIGAGHLSPGQVVVSVGRTSVHNVAELLDAIYSLPAHTSFTLGLLAGSNGRHVAITLHGSP
jgi:S1-C subfamily serine protease